jgi:hypothetical protein
VNLTRERKVYAAVLGLGALALVVDRAILAPADAAATPAVSADAAAPAAAPRAPAAPMPPRGESLASRLQRVGWDVGPMPRTADAFVADESWRREPLLAPGVAPPGGELAASFREGHRLTTVMAGRKRDDGSVAARPVAVIERVPGGEKVCIGEGDEIDGFRLVKIGERSVQLERAGTLIDLALPEAIPTSRETLSSPVAAPPS